MKFSRLFVTALAVVALPSCVVYEPAVLVPAITFSAEQITRAESSANISAAIDFGVDVAVNESDSLFNIETLPGVRVRSVTPGGAAAVAGIEAGDIILAINDTPTNHPDAIAALRQQELSGLQQFQIRRDTRVLLAEVEARRALSGTGPIELFRIDPLATRAGYVTELLNISGADDIAAARITALYEQSPLLSAGLEIGDTVLSINGSNISSAQDLINRLNQDFQLGETVLFGVYDGNEVSNVDVTLWDPGRRISEIALGPLLQYSSSLSPDSASLSILDFWLFAFYSYNRNEGERSHSLLGLFNFSTDMGELTELESQ